MRTIIHRLAKIHEFILDVLFPIRCISCGKETEWICEPCFSKIRIQDDHVCPVCEKMITPDGRTCLACKRKSPLDGLVVACSYKNDLISHAVHLYKYRFVSDLHVHLGELLVGAMKKTEIPLPDLIIPIPLHSRRLRWRGFNQSELLARHLATNLLPGAELPVDTAAIVRKKYTAPQMSVKKFCERQENIAGAFCVAKSMAVKNKTILLVDDIATTGSTLFECARILKKAGALEVFAVVIARQETNSKNWTDNINKLHKLHKIS